MAITAPGELDGDGCPSAPAGGVVAGAALDLVVDESVAEVLGYVLDVVSLQAEGLGGLECDESAGGGGKALNEGAAEAPG